MIYSCGADYLNAKNKRIVLFGMSGLGKTHLSNVLRKSGAWFHYSVDYRIGTRYMGELIADNFKREAMQIPLLRELLMSDAVYIASNITFDNLSPLSTYLGKPGDPALGGLPFEEYCTRQEQHRQAEIAASLDVSHFISRADKIYGYPNFVCDSSGSICEVVDPDDPNDPVLTALSQNTLMVWLRGTEAHTARLVERFHQAPKPMYYRPEFLKAAWSEYSSQHGELCDPDAFIRWTYARALEHRQPRYAAMAAWGITIDADKVHNVKNVADFDRLIGATLDCGASNT